jgi:hypothetical protein
LAGAQCLAEDALRDAQRLQTLEEQMRSALEQSKRQVQDIAALNSQLQAAQKARYLNPFTVLLGLLTLAALAFGALMWQRSRSVESGQPWWGKRAKRGLEDEQHLWSHLGEASDSIRAPLQKTADSGFAPSTNSLRASGTSGIAVTSATNEKVGLESKDTSPLEFKINSGKMALHPGDNGSSISSSSINQQGRFGRVDETTPPSVAVSMPQRAGKIDAKARTNKDSTSGFGQSEFASGAFGGSRLVAAEELFDIQEQADFFLSLGQPDQAIEVLKNHITDNVETSALAYMDLFDIYHRTNRQSDYADLREQFNHVFNAQVPEFARYGLQSNGLEDFPEVLGSIQSVWGQPLSAQDVIEASIFRQPDQAHPILDMTAYRELMLLYALAKELSRPDAGYSAVPMSMQTPVLALGGVLNTPDVDLGDGLVLYSSLDDLLSPEDRTVSLPHPLIKFSDAPNGDGSLDFDLSDSADLGIVKKSGKAPKFSN